MKPIQTRMARSALGWTTQDLAERAGVGINTVNRFEAGADARVSSMDKMKSALEAAGIVFIGDDGVRVTGTLDAAE
jgi:transcriptional regulator with XRE-family HTH domain